jgi:hypothetical protein
LLFMRTFLDFGDRHWYGLLRNAKRRQNKAINIWRFLQEPRRSADPPRP